MHIKKGDRVIVIDEDLEGIIERIINNETVRFVCSDGFSYEYPITSLIKIDELGKASFKTKDRNESHNDNHISFDKGAVNYNLEIKFIGKKPEFDLHIESLAPSKFFNNPHEVLEFQLDFVRQVLSLANRKRIMRLVFIHGIGKGVLREKLRIMLSQEFPNIEYFDGSYNKFGHGATEVIIHGQGKL